MPTKVYVRGLPNNCPVKRLEDMFSRYGEITELDVIKNFAFVHFSKESDASDAIKALDDTDVDNRKIEVKLARDQQYNRETRPPPKNMPPTKIYVGNLPEHYPRDKLSKLFEEFGKIHELDVIRNYGFVHMVFEDDAKRACEALHHKSVENSIIDVKISSSQRINRENRPPPRQLQASDRVQQDPLAALGIFPGVNASALSLGNLLPFAGAMNPVSKPMPASLPDVRVRREAVHVSQVPGADRIGLSDGFVIHERFYVTPDHPLLMSLPIEDLPRISDAVASSKPGGSSLYRERGSR